MIYRLTFQLLKETRRRQDKIQLEETQRPVFCIISLTFLVVKV